MKTVTHPISDTLTVDMGKELLSRLQKFYADSLEKKNKLNMGKC